MSQITLTPNNAQNHIGKLVKATVLVKAYAHLDTTVTPPFTQFQANVEVGVLQKVEQVKSDYWGLIKLKFPAKLGQKVLGVTSTKTYSDLYIPIKFLSVDDATPVPSSTTLTRDVWCTGNGVFLRKAPQASGDYINSFVKGNYIGKTDAVARKGGSYSGGDTWYTIQVPDGRIGYMASGYCTLSKPATTTKTTTPASTTPAKAEFVVPDASNTTRLVIRYSLIAVGAFVLYRLWKATTKKTKKR